jgi:hypothetical protein
VQWLERLKIFIITKEYEKIGELCSNIPSFDTLEELLEAQALINEALIITKIEKDSTNNIMQKIKKQSEFLSRPEDNTKFSIHS